MKSFSDYKKQFGKTVLWNSLESDKEFFADYLDENHDHKDWWKDKYWEDYVCEVFNDLDYLWNYWTERNDKEDCDPSLTFLLSPDKIEVWCHHNGVDRWQELEEKKQRRWRGLRTIWLSELYQKEMEDYLKEVDEDEI